MVDLNGKLRLHPDFKVAMVRIGAEHETVVVVDNFLEHAQLLVEYAAAHCEFDGVSDAFYPGRRAPVPPIYCFALRAFLGGIIAEAFGLKAARSAGNSATFPWSRLPNSCNTCSACRISTTPTRSNSQCCTIFVRRSTAVPPSIGIGAPAMNSSMSARKLITKMRLPRTG